MIKKIVASFCLLLSVMTYAQEGSSSPYSFYGIGDVRFKGTTEARSMGGIAVEQDSIHINLENPASFANLKLTSFTVGGTYNTTTMKTDAASEKARRTTLDYMALGLPLGKFGVGFGIIPYSSVGYKIRNIYGDDLEKTATLTSTGGVNKVFLGLGYKITPKFNIGVDVNYNFGVISIVNLETNNNIQSGTRETNTSNLSGVNFNIGSMYQTKISKKLSVFSSVNYSLSNDLKSKNTRLIETATVPETIDQPDRTISFGSKISLSAGIGQARKWLVGGKLVFQEATDLSNNYNESPNVTYGRAGSASIGGYYIPDYGSYSNYLKRIVYRGGFKYERTGLIIRSEAIDNVGFTMGVGLPISGTFSNMNIGFEIGKKGTLSSGLVQENYANISIGLSLNDKWFEKRKFN
ncbi:hypothetical protein FFWV33_06430 [Flavobacterium faecale]|uniref:Aromatic hydrocarbon degradation protein n=1 Tax=Flavobacterium faecale TaxID=1355330 RepID=A0A2S1LBR3_9FLAO|nr:hypothetical protein [Flavobacterium faecale]AWG21195.1 hypothetical protein FFWV33_06430 [Flavobacterium faecale]